MKADPTIAGDADHQSEREGKELKCMKDNEGIREEAGPASLHCLGRHELYLAQMKWCEREEPLCAGTNKAKVQREAIRIIKSEHGVGPVNRGAAMCSAPITAADIEIIVIPLVPTAKVSDPAKDQTI